MDGPVTEASTTHGQKRHADDNLERDQRLSKRFNLLNLENDGRLYIPVKGNAPTTVHVANVQHDSMQLDDTKDKVYIHNLAAELSDIESDEDTPLFLPDIEKKLSKIPQSVLTGMNPPNINTQMILYNVPSSLSLPKEQDSVRQAILDSRARTMEKQAQEQKAPQANELSNGQLGNGIKRDAREGDNVTEENTDADDDAMDIG
ncbi:MAG: hypothetical protein Q9216_002906 [Gyalolechia sp. 2 TL-2023]